MKNYRKGIDLLLKVEVTTNEVSEPLKDRNLRLVVRNVLGEEKELPFTIQGNIMVARFFGVDQKLSGMYRVTVWENFGEHGQSVFDIKNAFCLTYITPSVEGKDEEGISTEAVVELSGNMAIGIQGPSNYERACEYGFQGTEEEYLASLHGKPFTYSDFTPDQIAELQRPATEAAKVANEAATKAVEAAAALPTAKVIKQTNKVSI